MKTMKLPALFSLLALFTIVMGAVPDCFGSTTVDLALRNSSDLNLEKVTVISNNSELEFGYLTMNTQAVNGDFHLPDGVTDFVMQWRVRNETNIYRSPKIPLPPRRLIKKPIWTLEFTKDHVWTIADHTKGRPEKANLQPPATSAGPNAKLVKQFLQNTYGAEGIDLAAICLPSPDLWMLRGSKNPAALAAIEHLKPEIGNGNGVCSGVLGTDLYFVEIREGKVDPAFTLEAIYSLHKKLIRMFVYAALAHDKALIGRLSTDPAKVEMKGPETPGGDMDQYGSIIEQFPVLRSNSPAEDAKSKTVTYRLPLGKVALSLTLVKQGNTWKVDTSKGVKVPLELFFR